MPTAVSSTEPVAAPRTGSSWLREQRRAIADLGPLLRFRASAVRGRSRTVLVLVTATMLGLTVAASWFPAYLPEGDERRSDVLLLLPSGYIGVLVIALR